jgi:hypothetical protein
MATYSEIFGNSEIATKAHLQKSPTLQERLHLWRLAGYQPSPEQWAAHASPARLKLTAGGERGGKSYSAAMELVARHHLGELFWLIGPDYNLCRPEFRYLMDFFGKLGAIESLSFPSSPFQPCSMVLKGGIEITTITAKDTQKIAGRAPDGILGCEAAQLDYEVYLKCLGRLSEKNGWLWLSGTFEHDSYLSWYAEQYEKWVVENEEGGGAFSVPTWSNRAIYPGGLDDPKIQELKAKSPNEEWFLERYAGVPCPPPTAVFKEFRISSHVSAQAQFQEFKLDADGQVRKKDGKPVRHEVELAIDPGYNGAYAVLAVQTNGPIVNVIDEVYHQYTQAEDIIAECKTRPWWPNVRRGVIDIAGTQHQGLASHTEIWATTAGVLLESVRVDIPPGIARLRTFLSPGLDVPPRIFYNPKCRSSIKEFTLYRYRQVEEGKVTSEKPIDAFNHAAKAISYWLVARYGFVNQKPAPMKRRMKYGTKQKQQFRIGRAKTSRGIRVSSSSRPISL